MASFEYAGYIVKPDASGWMIGRPYTVKKGKHAGRTDILPVSFHGRLPYALEALRDYVLRDAPGSGLSVIESVLQSYSGWLEDNFKIEVREPQ